MAKKKAPKKKAAPEKLYTFVAGGALEKDTEFLVKCNCGGDAPITPAKVTGYGFSKKSGAMKVVDQIETKCKSCKRIIVASVLEGDPGYLLVSNGGVESPFLPQGSTSKPVSELTVKERKEVIEAIKKQIND